MKKNRFIYMVGLVTALFMMGCEDLEDTYDEYAGDGVIRYVGKASELAIDPGWKRLLVSWNGNLDSDIQKVKITWQSDLDSIPNVMYCTPKKAWEETDLRDTVSLEGLADAVYTVTVSNIGSDDSESITETLYGRPYSESHEDLRTFTRGIVNFYPVNNKLVVTLDKKNSNIKKILLHYRGTDGQNHTWNILKNMNREINYMLDDIMFILPDEDDTVDEGVGIDFSQPITIERAGLLEGCIDSVKFEPVVLPESEEIWSADFVGLMTHRFGRDWQNQVNHVETIELDYTMNTFQDLYYFPNLKKVVLGKNRYMLAEHQENLSATESYLAWVTLYYLNKLRGVEVECYNQHYLFGEIYGESYLDILTYVDPGYPEWGIPATPAKIEGTDWLTEKGCGNLSLMPEITPVDVTDWKLTCSDTTYNGYKTNGVGWILDNDPATVFEPGLGLTLYTTTVNIDMKKLHPLRGFKYVQPDMGSTGDQLAKDLKYLLSTMKIELSANGYSWEEATFDEGGMVTLGTAIGETTFIEIPQEKQKEVQYIRLTMNANVVGETNTGLPTYSLRIGDFMPY